MDFISDYPNQHTYIIKKVVNKYKYWIEKGQDIEILK